MIKFTVTCYHDAERVKDCKEVLMIPSDLLEFNKILFQCPECKNEIFVAIDFEGISK